MTRNAFIGFDSAWAGKAPGAVCFAVFDGKRLVDCGMPEPASFARARELVEQCRSDAAYTLVAVDQPTMVPNATGMRPVERVVSSVKRGVQPANLRRPLFDGSAPIWEFLDELGPCEDPRRAQSAETGLHLIEAFPGLALPGLLAGPCQLPLALHYNPAKRSAFDLEHWRMVVEGIMANAKLLSLTPLVGWAAKLLDEPAPTKFQQDCLDALICLIVALKWRRQHADMEVIGDWRGHMVTPLSKTGRAKVVDSATKLNVPIGRGSWEIHDAVLSYFDGNHFDALDWLAHPNRALGGESPLEFAATSEGEQEVINLIGRLAHGIPT